MRHDKGFVFADSLMGVKSALGFVVRCMLLMGTGRMAGACLVRVGEPVLCLGNNLLSGRRASTRLDTPSREILDDGVR